MTFLDEAGNPLDATFRVEGDPGRLYIVFESRGGNPPRNVNYAEGLRVVLARLAAEHAVLADVLIESRDTAALADTYRRVKPQGFSYPLRLAAVDDFDSLRRALGRS